MGGNLYHPMTTLLNTDTVEFTLQNTLRGHSKPINVLAISPDQTRLISVGEFSYFSSIPTRRWGDLLGDDSRVVVWSIASGERLFIAEMPFNGPATAAAWASRDNSLFIVGFASGDVHLFMSDEKKVIMQSMIACLDLISSLQVYQDSNPTSAGKGAIEGIVYDANHDRVASISAKSTQLWRINWPKLV